ncbi:glycosyltransferase family 4 protein [Marinobacter caseinilyticus]|uniref:glycosyltransferase family 4 protein n=1 Tax=Marinobacter caseinilyticus TaxID=2692195 RepID=UPI001F38598F|nr:glycosyltransferase family 4 protein [Marinobacter caseinilyticus]
MTEQPETDRVLPSVLCVTDACDLPESELFIGLHRAGFDVDVMANPSGRNYQRLVDAGVRVVPVALAGRFDKAGSLAIHQQLQSKQYTVIHTFNPRALACSLRASRGMRIKVVAYRGVIGNVGVLSPESWLTFLHPRLDRIVCVSDAVKRYFLGIRFLWMRIAPQKLVRIYKGHDLAWYQLPPADLSVFEFPKHAFVICCTGRDRPGKGFGTLIDSMEFIPDHCPVHLLLVGKLEENGALHARIQSSRHADRIRLAGFRTDAPQVAAACDAMVLPSESEGLPRVVIEAMAYCRPVVVTEAGGMPELVRHGEEGLVVPVKDPEALARAFIQLEADRDKATEMGRKGQNRIADDFNTAATVTETSRLYQELTRELTS